MIDHFYHIFYLYFKNRLGEKKQEKTRWITKRPLSSGVDGVKDKFQLFKGLPGGLLLLR